MEYKVVPFVASITKGQGAGSAAAQLASLINHEAAEGWQYVRMENIEINIHDPGKSGCLGFGAVPPSNEVIRYDMVVFSKA